MFEAAISPAIAATGAPEALRPLEWSELVARFTAARDLRAVLVRAGACAASFAARAEAGLQRFDAGQPDINLGALGGFKTPEAITVATVEEAAKGDQGTQ